MHFDRLMRDPVETLARAYATMGRTLHPEHAERIRGYLLEKPKGKFGVHHYAPEEWGFTAESLVPISRRTSRTSASPSRTGRDRHAVHVLPDREATCGLRVDVADNRMRKAKPGSSAGEGAATHEGKVAG